MRWFFGLGLGLVGCGDDAANPAETVVDVPTPDAVGRCLYVNAFSDASECKEYLGEAWSVEAARTDCDAPMPGADPGSFEPERTCERGEILGECVIDADGPDHTVLVFPGGYGDSCDGLDIGCSFAGGEFTPAPQCDDAAGPGPDLAVFTPFEQICTPALEGEPPGASGGDVCTWQAISGTTEEGRLFSDYADCDVVISQRPYWAASAEVDVAADDPRLTDPDWQDEYAWVTAQVEASACICCHSVDEAPNGEPSGWNLQAAPIWTESLDDDGMAMMAGWVDSSVFGAFAPEDNNGFARDLTGLPSTDPQRMRAFWEGELARRGLSQAEFVNTPPFGGPLYDQLVYEPSACADNIGLLPDGSLSWSGGDARYVYVLESDGSNPGVPPNLDLPDGTLWRLDVDPTATPVSSGLAYGSEPGGTFQAWPVAGDAPVLSSGQTYYLYVLADVYIPLTRCLFEAP